MKQEDIKKAIKEALVLHNTFKKIVAESVRKRIMEKTPPGKTKAGKPWEHVAKAIHKSSPQVNPFAATWAMKKKQRGESLSLEAFKEGFEDYMKEMGFKKMEGQDIWRKKKSAAKKGCDWDVPSSPKQKKKKKK